MNKLNILSKEKSIKVVDDWYPCFKNNTIKIKISLNNFNGYYVKIIACGADDFILEIEKDCENFEDAILTYFDFEKIYDNIHNGVDKEYFYKLGFKKF